MVYRESGCFVSELKMMPNRLGSIIFNFFPNDQRGHHPWPGRRPKVAATLDSGQSTEMRCIAVSAICDSVQLSKMDFVIRRNFEKKIQMMFKNSCCRYGRVVHMFWVTETTSRTNWDSSSTGIAALKRPSCTYWLCLGCNTPFSGQKKTLCERQNFSVAEII